MYSHLIETRHHKSSGKIIVCDIQVQKQTFSLGESSINTNKWLHFVHWQEFDAGLGNMLQSLSAVAISELVDTVFYLRGNIRVNVKRSEKQSRTYKRLIEQTDSNILALEIFIEQLNRYEPMRINNMITTSQESAQNDLSEENAINTSEYVPTITKRKKKDHLVCGEYFPYKPSSKSDTLTTSDIGADLNESYSPKPVSLLSNSSPKKVSESPKVAAEIPAYKPTKIRDKQRTADESVQAVNKEKEKCLPISKRRHTRLYSKMLLQQEKCSPEFSDLTSTPPAVKYPNSPYVSEGKKKRKRSNKYETVDCSLEKKYIEGCVGKKSSVKRDHNDKQASSLKKSSTPSHINKGHQTILDNSPSPSYKYVTNTHPPPPPKTTEDAAERAKHVDAQMLALRQLTEIILKHKQPTPEKVAILSLHHMNEEEILGTFHNFKSILDEIFEQLNTYRRIKGYKGLDHFKTIRLIEDPTQVKMLSFLKDHYQPDAIGIPTLTDLYLNVMVPEWTICIFMDKYNFTRDAAIKRLDDQEKYVVSCKAKLQLSMCT